MHKYYTLILTLVSGLLYGQDTSKWSVLLPEVPIEIDSVRFDPFLLYALNDTWVEASGGSTVADALNMTAVIPLRAYGPPGALVTGLSRSLSADHFNVEWNGVPIQSAALGLSDLSSLPLGLFDQSSLITLGRSTASAYGSAGGSLMLGSSQQEEIGARATYDELQNLRFILKSRIKLGANWVSDTRYQRNRNQNSFQFQDPYLLQPSVKEQEHNDYSLDAMLQSFERSFNHGVEVNASLWLQLSNLEIPEILGSLGHSFAEQSDSSLRLSLGASQEIGRWRQSLKYAWMETRQRYRDKSTADQPWLIESNINEQRHFFRYTQGMTAQKWTVRAGYELMQESVMSTSFEMGASHRFIHGPQLMGSYSMGKFRFNASGRMDFGLPETLPIGSLRIHFKENNLSLFAEAERIFRYPDMNELFWQPGGNENLRSEKGNALRVGGRITAEKPHSFYQVEAMLYAQRMDELILWMPGDAFWTVNNTDSVSSAGVDLRVRSTNTFGGLIIRSNVQAQVQANDLEEEALEAFFPAIQMRMGAEAMIEGWKCGVQGRFVSTSFQPEALNSEAPGQDAVLLADVFLGYLRHHGRMESTVTLMIQNVGNTMDHRLTKTASPQRIVALTLSTKWK